MNPKAIRARRADDARMARAYVAVVGPTAATVDLAPTVAHRIEVGAGRRSEIATWTRVNRRAILATMQQEVK